MSLLNQVLNSPINNSTAKQCWSFSKAERFSGNQRLVHDKVQYDIGPQFCRRAAGIGYGTRSDFTKWKGVGVPAPNTYEQLSDFSKDKSFTPQWTFGVSRDAVKVLVPGHFQPDKCVPGPGTYYKNIQFGSDAKKYSLRPRTANVDETTNTALKTPGPGTYKPKIEIDSAGKYFCSKFNSSKAATWNPPSSTRFQEQSILQYIGRWVKQLPGPGQYSPKIELNDKGQYFLSNYKNSLVRSFGIESKKSIISQVNDTPGPGTYRSFSDFGNNELPSIYNSRARTSFGKASRNRSAKSVMSEQPRKSEQL